MCQTYIDRDAALVNFLTFSSYLIAFSNPYTDSFLPQVAQVRQLQSQLERMNAGPSGGAGGSRRRRQIEDDDSSTASDMPARYPRATRRR